MVVANLANPPVQKKHILRFFCINLWLAAPGRGLPQGHQPLEQDIEKTPSSTKCICANMTHHNSLASHSKGLNPLSINPLPWKWQGGDKISMWHSPSPPLGGSWSSGILPWSGEASIGVHIEAGELIPCFKTHPPQKLQHWQPWGASHCQAGSWFAKHSVNKNMKQKKTHRFCVFLQPLQHYQLHHVWKKMRCRIDIFRSPNCLNLRNAAGTLPSSRASNTNCLGKLALPEQCWMLLGEDGALSFHAKYKYLDPVCEPEHTMCSNV